MTVSAAFAVVAETGLLTVVVAVVAIAIVVSSAGDVC